MTKSSLSKWVVAHHGICCTETSAIIFYGVAPHIRMVTVKGTGKSSSSTKIMLLVA